MELNRLLTTGSVGLDVLNLQQRLEDLGYAPDVDGFFGNNTARAATTFARDNGLASGAGVDAKFVEVLNGKVTAHAQAAKPADQQLLKATALVLDKISH
jgi:peptidoglycan hydrolase-like protein with peptidoglycan-binding domain